MMDSQPICRICRLNALEYFDLSLFLDNSRPSITYYEAFNICTNLDALPEDPLPKLICWTCAEDLKFFMQFIEKAKESDSILRENLSRAENDPLSFRKENYLLKVKVEKCEDAHLEAEIENENTCKQEEEYENILWNSTDEDEDELPVKTISDIEKELSKTKWIDCNMCGDKFVSNSSLQSHLLEHTSRQKLYPCDKCDKYFFSRGGLRLHLLKHGTEEVLNKFKCSYCPKGFATSQRLRVHTISHTGEKNFECDICSKKFGTKFRLQNHTRVHTGEKPFQCDICGQRFTRRNGLRFHTRRHTGERPHKCDICGKRFNQGNILKTHMALHIGKTVKCPLCDKMFSRPSYARVHLREHTGERPYACDKCPNKYRQKCHLDRHLATHMGIKHRCMECGKEYITKSSLRNHIKKHTDSKRFECPECSVSYDRKDRFRNHLEKVHNKSIEDVEYGKSKNSFVESSVNIVALECNRDRS